MTGKELVDIEQAIKECTYVDPKFALRLCEEIRKLQSKETELRGLCEHHVAEGLELAKEVKRLKETLSDLIRKCESEMNDPTQGGSETAAKMWIHCESARAALEGKK